MPRLILSAIAIAYLPGALIFRWPAWDRDRRAALGADERAFWHVVLSLAWSLAVVLALARFDAYRLDRLIGIDISLSILLVIAGRARLRYRGTARRPAWPVLLPLVLVALGCWRFFPPAEYIIGGKDPGTYINEGVQIAKTGSMYIREPVVAAVPPAARDLFFHDHQQPWYYSNRFMGFFLEDPAAGVTIGQFPHLYPASIALAYGLGGLTWALGAVGAWAVLGLLAVYFAGARFLGRPAGFAAAVLLSLNVLQVWFARSPGSEPATQALLFAALLAFARAHQDEDRFFGPVAGALLGLLLFLRKDAFMAVAAVLAAVVGSWIVMRLKPRTGFLVPLAAASVVGWFYVTVTIRAYSNDMIGYLITLPPLYIAGGIAVAVASVIGIERLVRIGGDWSARAAPVALSVVVLSGAVIAWFLRHQVNCENPCSKVAAHDAYALRIFTDFYLTRWGLVAALVGFILVLLRRHSFWRDPALVLSISGFAFAFFYKIRIQPYQFWLNRRYLPIVLPGMLLFAAAAALGPALTKPWPRLGVVRTAVGAALLGALGWMYASAAAPIMPHVEYAGIIGNVEQLASMFTDRDLVIVESRDAGTDVHVLGTPLAYLYDRKVLQLDRARPEDKAVLRTFLEHASGLYSHIYFIGGGTDLLSRRIHARPITTRRFVAPQYDDVPWNVYPHEVQRKAFDFGVYELTVGPPDIAGGFEHDIGAEDDLYVLRFYARDFNGRQPMRWTTGNSRINVPGLSGKEREVVLFLHDGGRPKDAPPAQVQVLFNNVSLGTVDVTGSDFRPYRLRLPAEVARQAGLTDDTAEIRLVSTTWNPQKLRGLPDSRDLGVMVSRVEVH
jgi:hypothetical protein